MHPLQVQILEIAFPLGNKRECNPFSCHVITDKSPSHCERKHHLESLSELLRLLHIENILFIPFRVMRRVRMQPF